MVDLNSNLKDKIEEGRRSSLGAHDEMVDKVREKERIIEQLQVDIK